MLAEILKNSLKKYTAHPVSFMYTEIIRVFSLLVTAFAATSIVLLALLAASTFEASKPYVVAITGTVALVALIFFAYMAAGYRGAMIHEFVNAEGGSAHMRTFYQNAMKKASTYFAIFILNFIIVAIAAVPVALIIYFMKLDLSSPIAIALILLLAGFKLLLQYIFAFAFISSAVKDAPAFASLKSGFNTLIKNPLQAVVLYAIYFITIMLMLVPGVNLVSLLALHPLVYLMMINMYRSTRSY